MKKFILFFAAFLLILSSTLYAQQGQMKSVQLTIGTGDKSGGLYPIGISIGKILNINSKIHKLTPDVIATEGAVYNIDKVLSGELMLGIVENDVQYRAYKGLGEWENAPQYDLRSIISLAPEIMQLIVSEQSKIKTLMDLQNKNINIGIIGENTYYNSQLILNSYGLDNYTVNYDNQSTSLKETIIMLQDGRLDGFFNPNSTKTLSVMTSIVTSSKTSNYAAYIIAKEIVENLHILKTLHPSFKNLDIKEMLKYNTAPIHPGAMRYYVDNGLLN